MEKKETGLGSMAFIDNGSLKTRGILVQFTHFSDGVMLVSHQGQRDDLFHLTSLTDNNLVIVDGLVVDDN